jgi:excisionase family DNA binding protein
VVSNGESGASARLLLRVEEGAKLLDISRARLYTLLSEGQIKSIKIGRSRRIPLSEIQRWIASEMEQQTA